MYGSGGGRGPRAHPGGPPCGNVGSAAPCDFCGNAEAVLYCTADRANLCLECDRKVHCANSLAERHVRTWICSNCRAGPAEVLCLHDGAALCRRCDAAVHQAPHAAHHKRQSLPPVPPAVSHPANMYAQTTGDSLFDSFLESLEEGPDHKGGAQSSQGVMKNKGKNGRAAGSSSSGDATYSGLDMGNHPSPMLFYGMPGAVPQQQQAPPPQPQPEPPKKPKRRGRPRKEEVAARAAARAAAQATLAKKYAYEQELKRREARMLHLMRERAQAGAAGADLVAFDGGGVPPRGGCNPGVNQGGPPSHSGRMAPPHQFGDDPSGVPPAVGLKLNNIQEGVVIRHEGGRYEWLDKSAPPFSGQEGGGALGEGPDGIQADSRAVAIARYKEKRLKRRYTNNLRYANRKEMADQRVRNKGRFVKKAA